MPADRPADAVVDEVYAELRRIAESYVRRERAKSVQATELVHIGLVAMLAGVGASLFNRVCFNYPTMGELYKFATYEALLKRAGLFPGAPALDP